MAANIRFNSRGKQSELLWFDLPECIPAPLNGNVWLLSLLPLAVARGEPIEISAPVDPILRRHAQELMTVWARWFKTWAPVEIRCPDLEPEPLVERPAAAFFTGGVDSFYSVLSSADAAGTTIGGKRSSIAGLVYVWGFDIPLRDRAAFERKHRALEQIAAELGTKAFIVATNLREGAAERLEWGQVLHGPALGAVASLLEHRFSSVLLSASSHAIDDGTPWGTHPLTDTLLSTSRVQVVRCGGDASRFEKTSRIARSDVALNHLHVCWKGGSDGNCGRCEKCVRTMAALELAGALDRTQCFPEPGRLIERLNSIRIREPLAVPLWEELKEPAVARGRGDLAAAIDHCIERSRTPESLAFWKRAERRIRTWRSAVFHHE